MNICAHEGDNWNVITTVSRVENTPSIPTFVVKSEISCALCGVSLKWLEGDNLRSYFETVMFA
jgi:hypothetical protein